MPARSCGVRCKRFRQSQRGCEIDAEGPGRGRELRLLDQDHQKKAQDQTHEGAQDLGQRIDPHTLPALHPQCPKDADLPGGMEHRQSRKPMTAA